ncbi:MAG TPA: M48 family metallopeptidase [Marinagarivorans sp.]
MNFFEHQDKARRLTTRLVVLFGLAVIAVVVLTAGVAAGVYTYFQMHQSYGTTLFDGAFWSTLFTRPEFVWCALGTLVVIILGSAYKTLQLGGNGIQVALSMDAKHVHPETDNPQHKQLFNIVTEMAIASGNPVPKVFVLPGDGINAFAAGYNRHQTVVAVTEGALAQLTRDELQGVVAHEFSHINFGDVKINMRLVALLHGILIIGLIGQHIAGGSHFRRRRYGHTRSNNKGASIGFALMAIGYSGTFFGNIIKAAVSRQREFLADASAVQFTRNPEGIASALKKIARGPDDASISSENAEQFSHFYFASLRPHFFSRLFATHPDINQRITRLGHQPERNNPPDAPFQTRGAGTSDNGTMGFGGSTQGSARAEAQPASTMSSAEAAEALINCVGQPSARHLASAQSHIAQLPDNLVTASHDAFSARALVYSFIIAQTPQQYRTEQQQFLNAHAHPATVKALTTLLPSAETLSQSECYNLLLMSEGALQDQSPEQARAFRRCAKALIEADKQLTLFEWCIYRLAISPLESPPTGHRKLHDCSQALGMLFYYAASHAPAAQRSAILSQVNTLLGVTVVPPESVSIKKLDNALQTLAQLKPLSKPALLKALVACIKGDGKITDDEMTLLRMVALVLDCPVPDIIE